MKQISTLMVMMAIAACGGSGGSGGGSGTDGGGRGGGSSSKVALGNNASVPVTCQMCLATSSGNECDSMDKICSSDSECVALNTCINNCANINAACISSCGDAASQNAINEWNDWSDCTCGTCSTQCNQTFCNIGGGGGGGSSGGACIADNVDCSNNEPCCTFCASDDTCGCIPSGDVNCASNQDCCSGDCEQGTCN